MHYSHYRDFQPSLTQLKRKFGQYQKGAEDVEALLGRISMLAQEASGVSPFHGLTRTHHGESRIRNCVKYQLSGAARLVTVQTDKLCILLFTGTHDEVQRWIETQAGIEFLVDSSNNVVQSFRSTESTGELLSGRNGTYPHELLKRLSDDEWGDLLDPLPWRVLKKLQEVRTGVVASELRSWLGVLENKALADAIQGLSQV